jgi:hypothetical protein
VLPEIAAFSWGTKPALRFTVNRKDAGHLHATAQGLGLNACIRQVFLVSKGNGWHEIVSVPTSRRQYLVAITACGGATDVVDAELEDCARAGFLLGYPECCIGAMSAIAAASDLWALHLLKDEKQPINARLNRFAAEWGGIGLMGELFPCSLHCPAAAAYAQNLHDSMTSLGLHKLADAAKADALAAVHVTARGRVSRAVSGGEVGFFW